MQAHPLADFEAIQAFLETDRLWAAYALGDLESSMRPQCEWYGAIAGERTAALALVYDGFTPPALFTMGDGQGIASILGSAMRAPSVYLNVCEEHLPAIQAHYRLESLEPMWRMALQPADFQPVPDGAMPLTLQDIQALKELYALGGGDAFMPGQVFAGVFYGVEERGQLIAAAGTHVLSETYSVAAAGNVFTHPERRGKGYAARATSAVCAELVRRGIRTIILNVARDNAPAIHVYEKLGFKKYLPFIEGVATRK
jgi:ribosomal protein S18 acetylase RimI-like enzyme